MKSMEWQQCGVFKKLILLLATGFGLGLSPMASGTAGALIGLLMSAFLTHSASIAWQIVVAVILSLVAVPICDVAEGHFRWKDDGRIVADEYMTFPICTIGLPPEPWILAVAFVTNRVCDIIKPPPAHALQRLKGGTGVVVDDVLAALYSLLLNHFIYQLVHHLR
jgi:phosphatidylglycerophosphatase A